MGSHDEKLIRSIISEYLCIPEERILYQFDLEGDLGASEQDKVELLEILSEEFGFEITKGMHDNIDTVGDLCNLVETLA